MAKLKNKILELQDYNGIPLNTMCFVYCPARECYFPRQLKRVYVEDGRHVVYFTDGSRLTLGQTIHTYEDYNKTMNRLLDKKPELSFLRDRVDVLEVEIRNLKNKGLVYGRIDQL